ncbi:MAG: hypothetical protein IJ702_06980 [Fretibacterium sp.]|nr:hypothetical protein [Fretibacterium sp.]
MNMISPLELELDPENVFATVPDADYQAILERLDEQVASDMTENEIQAAKSIEYASKFVALI